MEAGNSFTRTAVESRNGYKSNWFVSYDGVNGILTFSYEDKSGRCPKGKVKLWKNQTNNYSQDIEYEINSGESETFSVPKARGNTYAWQDD